MFVLLAIAALFIGCEPETYLFVDEKPLSFSSDGGSVTIDLVANKDWTATSDNSWCTVSPTSGEGDVGGTRLTVRCSGNDSYENRTAAITVICAEMSKRLTVSQSQNNALIISQKEFSLDEKGGTISITVQSNVSYSCEIIEGSSWIEDISTRGLLTQTKQFAVKENTTYDAREGKIRFSDSTKGITEDVVVRQTKNGAIIITQKEYNVGSDGGTITVEVKSNVDYKYQIIEGSSWIEAVNTKSLTTKNVQFSIKENTTYDDREGKIRFSETSGLCDTVVVRQSRKGAVIIEKKEYEVTYEAQMLDISLLENTAYEVKIVTDSQGWIKKVDTKGLQTSSFTLSIEENENKDREGVVYVTTSSDIITLKIKQADGTITIPDANFRQYCISNFDKNGDGALSHKEAREVQDINVNTDNIYSLEGIGYFIELQTLDCHGEWAESTGKLSILDLSNNAKLIRLSCYSNQLTDLDITNIPALQYLNCSWNQLAKLDVSNNNALSDLWCNSNQLKSLNVTNNLALKELSCNNNQLTSLDVSNNTKLVRLFCDYNELKILDISQNNALTLLYCAGNQLTNLDVSKNTALELLGFAYNQLTTIDVSNNTSLTNLYCYYNQLSSLDVAKNILLKDLWCDNNRLSSLDISMLSSLSRFNCNANQLTSLDVRNNTSLTELLCSSNQLTSLDVTRNTALTYLKCGSNQLTSLDVTKNTLLTSLDCSSNRLTSLNLSYNTKLNYLNCNWNQLTLIDVSKNTLLDVFYCYSNYPIDIYLAKGQTFTSQGWNSDATVYYK